MPKAATPPDRRPLYEQIKILLTNSLVAGEWKPGEAIPSEMELAARYRVSQGTVSGSNGRFRVLGRHRYAAAGRYAVRVDVAMASTSQRRASAISTAAVGGPLRVIKHAAKVRNAPARRNRRA